ncbi:MAG TPA: hypothetical protein VK932_12240 [Kofleriaceae bacterium]|nr:hypothetical protein [Kofleriaceae bacterium]
MTRAGRLAMVAMAAAVAMAATLASACPGTGGPPGGGGGGGGDPARLCEGLRPKVEQLYRADAAAKEPQRVDEAVADNTTMVMNDCIKAPARVAPCVDRVSTVAELEQQCLLPLDDEGSEGEELRK